MTPFEGIIKFNTERNLFDFDAKVEYNLLAEELQEFQYAGAQEDEREMVDALCDLIVVATGGLFKLGYDPTAALSETVKEILSRKGGVDPDTGKWEKDRSQDPTTLYKANYAVAK